MINMKIDQDLYTHRYDEVHRVSYRGVDNYSKHIVYDYKSDKSYSVDSDQLFETQLESWLYLAHLKEEQIEKNLENIETLEELVLFALQQDNHSVVDVETVRKGLFKFNLDSKTFDTFYR